MNKIAVTVREAAEISGLSRTTLYRLFAAGKIKPRKFQSTTLILVAELEEFLESLPVAGTIRMVETKSLAKDRQEAAAPDRRRRRQ